MLSLDIRYVGRRSAQVLFFIGQHNLITLAHHTHIEAFTDKELAELLVFLGLHIGGALTNEEKSEHQRHARERRAKVERCLVIQVVLIGKVALQVFDSVGTRKGANLTNGSCDTVKLTLDSSSTRLGGKQSKIITRAKLAKAQEETIQDTEDSNVSCNLTEKTRENETNNNLESETDTQAFLRADRIDKYSTQERAGDVEAGNDDIPAKSDFLRRIRRSKVLCNNRRVQTEGVYDEIVNEPNLTIAFDMDVEIELKQGGYLPVENNPELARELMTFFDEKEGIELIDIEPAMTGEDFGYLLSKVPGVMFWLGIDSPYALHHPKMSPKEEALAVGVEAVSSFLAKKAAE